MRVSIATLTALLVWTPAFGQKPPRTKATKIVPAAAEQKLDDAYTAKVREYTTERLEWAQRTLCAAYSARECSFK